MQYRIELSHQLAPPGTVNDLLYVPVESPPSIRQSRLYLFSFEGCTEALQGFAQRVLHDSISESLFEGEGSPFPEARQVLDISLKPGLLDHERESVLACARQLNTDAFCILDLRIHQRIYLLGPEGGEFPAERLIRDRVNPAIHKWSLELLHDN